MSTCNLYIEFYPRPALKYLNVGVDISGLEEHLLTFKNIENASELVDLIEDYVIDNLSHPEYNNERLNDWNILDLDDVFNAYKYLINKNSCCRNCETTYCPECGKKLK